MDTTQDAGIRCFVAVEIPEPIQALLKPVQTHLRSEIHKGTSWTKPGNLHLTLKFLGDVHPEAINDVSEVLERVTDAHPPFSIDFWRYRSVPESRSSACYLDGHKARGIDCVPPCKSGEP